MNINWFIAKRISGAEQKSSDLSRPVIQIATGGIILGVTVMILTVFIVRGFQKEVKDRAIAFGAHLQLVSKEEENSGESLPILLKQPILEKLQNKSEIRQIQPFMMKNGIIKTKTENEGVVVKGIGENYDWGYIGKNIVKGSAFQEKKTDATDYPVLISSIIANRLQLNIDDKIILYFIVPDTMLRVSFSEIDTLIQQQDLVLNDLQKKFPEETPEIEKQVRYTPRARAFRVNGIYETGLEEYDKKIVFTTQDALKKIYRWPENTTGGFEIYLKDFTKLEKLTNEIYYELINENLTIVNVEEKNQGIFEWLKMHDTTGLIVLVLMTSVAIINMTSALIIIIIEKVNLIGILKSLGMNNQSVRRIFLIQAAKIIFKGLLFGNLLGLLLAIIQNEFHIVKLDQAVYYMPYVPIHFAWGLWALLNTLTFISCFIFMLLPAIVITKTSPLKAIKFS